jgi:hypothetical protein
MAEPSTFPEEHVTPPVVYRRISGLAIASLTVALLFALCLLLGAITGFRDHSPLLLPVWLQMLPVIAAVLALAALYLIRHSEGTLAGARMAGWGWWLAVILGLGYWAYYGATYLAVVQQAETFTLAWLEKMANRKFPAALLDTQEPATRLKINPEDVQRINTSFGRIAQLLNRESVPVRASDVLRNMDVGRILNQGGPESKIAPLGVFDWEYKEGTYTVRRLYQITTREGEWRAKVTVRGMESRTNEFPGRQWYVVANETALATEGNMAPKLSAEGEKVGELSRQAANFIQSWHAKLVDRKLAEAYLDTRPPGERAELRAGYERGLVLAAFIAAPALVGPVPEVVLLRATMPLDSELGCELYLNGYFDAFTRRALLHAEDFYVEDQALQPLVIRGINRLLGSREEGPPCVGTTGAGTSSRYPWNYDEHTGRFQISYEVKLAFPPVPGSLSPYVGLVVITLLGEPASTDSQQQPTWQVLRVDLVGAGEMGSGPGGRRGRGRAMPPPSKPNAPS